MLGGIGGALGGIAAGWAGKQLGLGPKAPMPSGYEKSMTDWLSTITPYAKQYLSGAGNLGAQLPQVDQGYAQARTALQNYQGAYAPGQGAGTLGLYGRTLADATRGILGGLGQAQSLGQARFAGADNSVSLGMNNQAIRSLMQVLAQGENQRAMQQGEANRYASQALPGLYAGPMQQRMALAQLGAGLGSQAGGMYGQLAGMNDQRNAMFQQQQGMYGQQLGELLAQAMAQQGRPMTRPRELPGYGNIATGGGW